MAETIPLPSPPAEIEDFSRAAVLEAQHQRARWGSDHDAGKTNADWFWLVGYLAGKALTAANASNVEKALHHTISTAAALANWHAALSGIDNSMRPGIEPPVALSTAEPARSAPASADGLVEALEAALAECNAEPQCCGRSVPDVRHGQLVGEQCCGSPEYGFERAAEILRAALNRFRAQKENPNAD